MNHQAIFNQANAGPEVPEINNNGGYGNGGRHKGVVPKPNGRWGAQIYMNQQIMWLGAFGTEREAAMAYDSAAVKLRKPNTNRNIPLDNQMVSREADFQSQFSVEEVLGMIRDGSYQRRLREFCMTREEGEGLVGQGNVLRCGPDNRSEAYYAEFFEKQLTPSDVGKLSRLVIPKRYAVKFFPQLNHQNMGNQGYGNSRSAELDFVDRSLRNWRFKSCYRNNGQTFALERRWNKFVRDKHLTNGDTVLFYRCEMLMEEGRRENRRFCLIDVRYHHQRDEGGAAVADEAGPSGAQEEPHPEENAEEREGGRARIGFKLFGVHINA